MDAIHHTANLRTLHANIASAIRNHATVDIAGGRFRGVKLESLLIAVTSAMEVEKPAGTPATTGYACECCEDRGWVQIESGLHGSEIQACDCESGNRLASDDAAKEAHKAWLAANAAPPALRVFANPHFLERSYEHTNIVAVEATQAPANNWTEADRSKLDGLTKLWTQAGVTYWGYL